MNLLVVNTGKLAALNISSDLNAPEKHRGRRVLTRLVIQVLDLGSNTHLNGTLDLIAGSVLLTELYIEYNVRLHAGVIQEPMPRLCM